jgi:hypothetical protein
MIEDEFLQDCEMFEDEEKFWEEMNGIKRKKMKEEVEEEEMKKEVEEKMKEEKKIAEEKKEKEVEVKEEEMEVKEEEKPTAKKHCRSLYNKYKRKGEGENTGEYNIYKKTSVPEYFQNACEQLTNDEKNLYNIFKEYLFIFTRHYKYLERIVYERERLKKRQVAEVTWIYDS